MRSGDVLVLPSSASEFEAEVEADVNAGAVADTEVAFEILESLAADETVDVEFDEL